MLAVGPLVLIGPVCVGKSIAGRLAAERLGREFLEADDQAQQVYERGGWTGARFADLNSRHGAEAAYADFEVFVADTAVTVLAGRPAAVVAMGAGHTHYRTEQQGRRVRQALADARARVCLLLPHEDPDSCVRLLRGRALRDRNDDFVRGDRDLLSEWVRSSQNRELAHTTIITRGQTPRQTAAHLAAQVANP